MYDNLNWNLTKKNNQPFVPKKNEIVSECKKKKHFIKWLSSASFWTILIYCHLSCLIVNWIFFCWYVDVWFQLCEGYTVAWWSQCDIVILTEIYSRNLVVTDCFYRCVMPYHCRMKFVQNIDRHLVRVWRRERNISLL